MEKEIVDANFLVALFYPYDSHHQRAKTFLSKTKTKPIHYFTNNYLIAEAITVLLIRSKNIKLAAGFASNVYENKRPWFTVFQIDEPLQFDSYRIFKNQKKYKGGFFSFADCTLITQAKRQKISTILTFDQTFKQLEKSSFTILP